MCEIKTASFWYADVPTVPGIFVPWVSPMDSVSLLGWNCVFLYFSSASANRTRFFITMGRTFYFNDTEVSAEISVELKIAHWHIVFLPWRCHGMSPRATARGRECKCLFWKPKVICNRCQDNSELESTVKKRLINDVRDVRDLYFLLSCRWCGWILFLGVRIRHWSVARKVPVSRWDFGGQSLVLPWRSKPILRWQRDLYHALHQRGQFARHQLQQQ